MSVLNAIQGVSKLQKKVFTSAFSPQIQNSALTSQPTNKSFQAQRKTRTLPNPPALNATGKRLTFNNKAFQKPFTNGTRISNGSINKRTFQTSTKKAFGVKTIQSEKFAHAVQ